jgi:hypothetical protein
MEKMVDTNGTKQYGSNFFRPLHDMHEATLDNVARKIK